MIVEIKLSEIHILGLVIRRGDMKVVRATSNAWLDLQPSLDLTVLAERTNLTTIHSAFQAPGEEYQRIFSTETSHFNR